MRTIQVYDPPMCCSTGACGNDMDPALVNFAALLSQLKQQGVQVERYNLGQEPMAFVQNPKVKGVLDKDGIAALPIIFVDGEIRLQGRYLTGDEREAFSRAVLGADAKAAL